VVFVAFAYWFVHLRGEKRESRSEKNQ